MKLVLTEKDSIFFHLKSYNYAPSKELLEKIILFLN
jgi:hypothetical protein